MNRQLDEHLSLGTLGHKHLLGAAQKSFALVEAAGSPQARTDAIETGARLLGMSWGEFLLNAPLAGEIVQLSGNVPAFGNVFGDKALELAARIASERPLDETVSHRLFVEQRYDELAVVLERMAAKGQPLEAVRQGMLFMGTLSRWEWVEDFVKKVLMPSEPVIASLIMGEVLLSSGRFAEAVDVFQQLEGIGMPGMRFKAACASAGAGDTNSAVELLGRELNDSPWHTTALMVLDSLIFPSRRDVRLGGRCDIAIYSYNKSAELARTLDSVLASDLGAGAEEVVVRVLINGSADDSLAVAEAARKRFRGRMEVIDLPVNVGAPAARNWLLDAAMKDGAEWLVYLDDDVEVPSDWLAGLAAGTRDFPKAGVWGCRVADAQSPCITQHGDAFLLDEEGAAQQGRRVALYAPSAECLSPVLLGYRRYAATVTGCCHLFRTETLARSQGFDLAFSPSQYDDLDSDLRLLRDEKPVAYLGDVGINHLRVSPRLVEPSPAAKAQSDNHRLLLEERHAGLLSELRTIQLKWVDEDIAARRSRLQDAGVLPVRR